MLKHARTRSETDADRSVTRIAPAIALGHPADYVNRKAHSYRRGEGPASPTEPLVHPPTAPTAKPARSQSACWELQ